MELNKDSNTGRRSFILRSYFRVIIIPLILIIMAQYLGFSDKSFVFLGSTLNLVSAMAIVCFGLTVSLTGALIACEPIPYDSKGYKPYVWSITVILFVVSLLRVFR